MTRAPFLSTVRVLLGDGAQGFAEHFSLPLGLDGQRLIVVDLDLDGNLDVLTANSVDHSISLLYGDGSGGLTRAPDIVTGFRITPFDIQVADINGDLKPDIVVPGGNEPTLSVILAR